MLRIIQLAVIAAIISAVVALSVIALFNVYLHTTSRIELHDPDNQMKRR